MAMGDNDKKQISLDNVGHIKIPQNIHEHDIVSMASGSLNIFYLKTDGSLWAKGRNNYGQLGNGTTTDVTQGAVKVVDENVTAISAGYFHTLFIKEDGSLWGMGKNIFGQLGDGTYSRRPTPIKIVDANVTSISAGAEHSAFIKSDGSLWTMGRNDYGQLGNVQHMVVIIP